MRAGRQTYATSAFLKQALDKGAELFKWEERKAQQRQARRLEGARRRRGGQRLLGRIDRLRRAASSSSPTAALAIQSGIGNLGTESVFDVHRVAAELLGVPWEKCDITWGNTSKNVPNTCGQGGSQTTHAMTRAAHAAAMDAKKKLQEIAAKTLGGSADIVSGGERTRVGRRPQPDARAGGAEGDRARRQVRRPRTAGRHQRASRRSRPPRSPARG